MPARDIAILVLICVVWAGNFLTSAYSLREFPPFLFTGLRMALLAVILVPFLKPAAPGQWPRLVAIALVMGVLHFGFSFWGLQLAGNLASPAIVMQSYVPMAALLAWFALGERFGWRTALGIGASFAGVLVLGLDPLVLQAPASLLVMLAAAAFLAVGTVLMRGLVGQSLFSLQGWTAVLGVGPLLLIGFMFEPGARAAFDGASWIGWGGVAYSALLSSLLGHGLYYRLLLRHKVADVTPWLLLTPVMAVGLGIAFWGDRPGPRLYLGGALVLGGVLFVAMRARTKARPLPPAEDA